MALLGVTSSSLPLGGNAFINYLTLGSNDQFTGIFIDSSSYATYMSYSPRPGSVSQGSVIKMATDGAIAWQQTSTGTNSSGAFGRGGTDSSQNVYYGQLNNNNSQAQMYLYKLSKDNAVLVQRTWNEGNSPSTIGRAISVSPNGSHIAVASTGGTNFSPILARFDTGLNLAYQNSSNTSAGQNYAVVAMNSGNIVSDGGSSQFMVSGSSTLVWGVTSGSDGAILSCTNSAGQLFGLSTGGSTGVFVNINPANGTANSARQISTLSSPSPEGICANATFVYTLYREGATNRLVLIKRRISDNVVIWQRTISISGTSIRGWNSYTSTSGAVISVDENDKFVWIAASLTSGANGWIFKLPADGSKTGSYSSGGQTISYAASSFTDAALTATRTSSTFTPASASLTSSTAGNSLNTNILPSVSTLRI